MKKKTLLFPLVCVILLICSVLTACSLVKTNEERKASRVMATVTVDLVDEFGSGVKVLGEDWDYVVSLDVTRREVTYTVNYAINYYSQLYSQYDLTYNYDVENLLDSGFKSLKTQKYNVIRAMGELLATSKTTGRFDAMYCRTAEYQAIYGKTLVPEGVLTLAERYAIIGEVNETFESRLESYIGASEDDERDKEISEANDAISGYYGDGYFTKSVAIAYKNADGNMQDGLYETVVVDDGNSDTADIDYKQVYAKVTLEKEGATDAIVYVPVDSTVLTLAADEDAPAMAKYMTAKIATISHSGRVYAEKTEDNGTGYEVVSVKSEPVSYTLVTPRTAAKTEEEDEDALLNALRYTTVAQWTDEADRTEEMNELAAEIFDPSPAEYKAKEKDAYRQLRTYFKSANVGFAETEPDKSDAAAYRNYTYYNGLQYYYDAEFSSHVTEVLEYELGQKITEVSGEEIEAEYNLLVAKDKANYEYLSSAEQVTKFFETVSSTSADGLTNVYYVPVEALLTEKYEVDPTDKKYAPLFTIEGGVVTAYNDFYIDGDSEPGKYFMHYAYENPEDGTVTINMIYVTHILFSFDNVVGLKDKYTAASMDYEDKLIFVEMFAEMIETCPQLTSYLANYDANKTYGIADVFATDEEGELDPQSYDEAQAIVNLALTEAFATGKFEDLLDAFITLMEQYNDDGGKLTTSGYMVSAGEMKNSWYKDFTDTALNLYFGLLNAGKAPTGYEEADGTTLADRTAIAYSDYGAHDMFLSFTPLYHVSIDENGGLGVNAKLTKDGLNRKDEIGESLIKTKREKAYSDWQAKATEEKVAKYVTVHEKDYKNFVKEIKD